jgi:hypothetical protein
LSFYVHLRDVFTTHNGAQHLIVAPPPTTTTMIFTSLLPKHKECGWHHGEEQHKHHRCEERAVDGVLPVWRTFTTMNITLVTFSPEDSPANTAECPKPAATASFAMASTSIPSSDPCRPANTLAANALVVHITSLRNTGSNMLPTRISTASRMLTPQQLQDI